MDIQKALKIKDMLELFPRTKVDVILEDNILISNTRTEATYKISYTHDDIVGPIIDTTNAETIVEKKIKPTKLQHFKEHCNILMNSISKVFEGDVSFLKKAIHTLPNVNLSYIMEEIYNNSNSLDAATSQHQQTKLYKLFIDKINKYNAYKEELEQMFNLFDENDDLIPNQYVHISYIKEALEYLSEQYEYYLNNANIFNNFFEKINDIFKSEEITHKFLENFDYDNVVASITKQLVAINKQYNESIEIVENSKKIYKIFEECDITPIIKTSGDGVVNGAPSPTIFNLASDNKFRPKFFKFKMGLFTPEDVKTMLNEINFIIQNAYADLTPEDLELLSSYKKNLNYMYHTGQINDHVIMTMINAFNLRYAQDQSGAYNDPSQQLDWKSREQQSSELIKGFANSANSIAI